MDPALTSFLNGLLDYAGLFPPAKLPMEPAVRNYLAYREGPDAFMLGRFICPAARLPDLAPHLPAAGPPVALAVLVDRPEEDLDAVRAFLSAHGARAEFGACETRIPAADLESGDPERVRRFARAFAAALAARGLPPVPTAFEATSAAGLRAALATAVKGLAGEKRALLKVRCGGATPAAFPAVGQLAFAIGACRDARLPMKATAGLHHPVRGVRGEAGVAQHGFLNFFGGAVLAVARNLQEERLVDVLKDETAASFGFGGGRFLWRGLSASAAEVAKARTALASSFGTCSFDEPREGLRKMGVLP
jgi:hypothetical protein